MKQYRKTGIALASALLAAAGCGSGAGNGPREPGFQIQSIPSNATRILIQISGPGFATFEKRFDRHQGQGFQVRFQVPVGLDRLVFARALDAGAAELSCGKVLFDVPEGGQVPNVRIDMDPRFCPPEVPPVRSGQSFGAVPTPTPTPLPTGTVPTASATPTPLPTPTATGATPSPTLVPTATPAPTGATVTTLAGNGVPGFADGTGAAAIFNGPAGIALDGSGNIIVASTLNHRIRKVTPAGVVTTIAGSGGGAFADGTGTAAAFNGPGDLALDSNGNIYVADTSNHRIRKIDPQGVVTTLAGGGAAAFGDGTGTNAFFSNPSGVVVDSNGNVYVGDTDNRRMRRITPAGVVTTLAGNGVSGSTDGTGTAAQFGGPRGLALDSSGNIYVADFRFNIIRKVTPAGVVTTIAGNTSGLGGFADGTGTAAQFDEPDGLAVDGNGNIYVADRQNFRIRKITSAGVVTTLAGTGTVGSADGPASTAQFGGPVGVAVDNTGTVFVGDAFGHRIRKINP